MATLRVTSGPRAGETIEVTGELVIGRHEADLAIDDPEISRRHAVVRSVGVGLELEDLGSRNGTFVDGERVERPVLLRGGAKISLGGTVIEVKDQPLEADDTVLARTRARAIAPELPQGLPVQPGADAPGPESVQPAVSVPPAGPPAEPATPGLPSTMASVGAFRPPVKRRGGGLASRSWVPVFLSFGTVVLTAIALVIYFAAR
jgi:pSer/pThr/pTyr-binding forkhead associated (FHA) protein